MLPSLAVTGPVSPEGEHELRLLSDNAPVLLCRTGPDRSCAYCNKPWLDFTGRALEQQLGNGWTESIHPDDRDRFRQAYIAASEGRREFSVEYRLRRHDGAYRWVLHSGRPYDHADGSFAGYVHACMDVTGRKDAEERLRGAVSEKEQQLRELHHRAKNNMQLILSLLRLQGKRAGTVELKAQLDESAARVHAVALAQSELSRDEGPADCDLANYLQQIVASLRSVYGRDGISIHVDVSPMHVSVQRAVPLGLMANELVANALKHAFADGRNGRIEITGGTTAGRAQLLVADDGAGMPNDLFPSRGGLGFQLVLGLASQAGATVKQEPAPVGTRFAVEFPAS